MVKAIIWDYDGTLVDTRRKNLAVTKEIMQDILEDSIENYQALQSLDHYQAANEDSQNWRGLYKKYFQLSDFQIDKAGSMWREYQIKNETEAILFENITKVLNEFANFKHGIVSQNAYANIISYLRKQELDSYFSKVIGYEEIGYDQQKPNPTGLLKCIQYLTDLRTGSVVYIGDHETDIQCAYLANEKIKETRNSLEVISIAALYGFTNAKNWEYKPDFEAHDPNDIISIINNLAI